MGLSSRAWTQLQTMVGGQPVAPQQLAKAVGGQNTADDLIRSGHLVAAGKGFARTQVSIDALNLFDLLPSSGAAVANSTAQRKAGWDNPRYSNARALLLATGEVTLSRGPGGAIRRLVDIDTADRVGGYTRELDMYEPFEEYLNDLPQQLGQIFRRVVVTGTGRNQRRRTGQWSKPDLAVVTLTRFPMLPTMDVEVETFELKLLSGARSLSSVYEASAHQRRAHLSWLVVEHKFGDGGLDESLKPVEEECQRLGVGLALLWNDEVWDQVLPLRKSPDPGKLNDFIEDILTPAVSVEYQRHFDPSWSQAFSWGKPSAQ